MAGRQETAWRSTKHYPKKCHEPRVSCRHFLLDRSGVPGAGRGAGCPALGQPMPGSDCSGPPRSPQRTSDGQGEAGTAGILAAHLGSCARAVRSRVQPSDERLRAWVPLQPAALLPPARCPRPAGARPCGWHAPSSPGGSGAAPSSSLRVRLRSREEKTLQLARGREPPLLSCSS